FLESPAILTIPYSQPCCHPTIKNSLIGAGMATRDNTVICSVRTGRSSQNRPRVAQLPRRKTSTKPELSAHAGAESPSFRPYLPVQPTVKVNAGCRYPLPYGVFALRDFRRHRLFR